MGRSSSAVQGTATKFKTQLKRLSSGMTHLWYINQCRDTRGKGYGEMYQVTLLSDLHGVVEAAKINTRYSDPPVIS